MKYSMTIKYPFAHTKSWWTNICERLMNAMIKLFKTFDLSEKLMSLEDVLREKLRLLMTVSN